MRGILTAPSAFGLVIKNLGSFKLAIMSSIRADILMPLDTVISPPGVAWLKFALRRLLCSEKLISCSPKF